MIIILSKKSLLSNQKSKKKVQQRSPYLAVTVLNRLMLYVRCAELPLSGKNLKSNLKIDLRYYDNDYHYNNSAMVSQLTQSPLQIANPEKLERIRHTCAHVMAMAVQILFPETKVTIGPTTDTGFYYDFDRPQPFTPEDLKKITKQMRFIIKANLPIIREEVTREEIKAEIEQLNESYKLEILDSIPEGETITRYYIGSPAHRSHQDTVAGILTGLVKEGSGKAALSFSPTLGNLPLSGLPI